MSFKHFKQLRKDYNQKSLDISNCNPDPIKQFLKWYKQAVISKIPQPNAMALATVGVRANPSLRMLLYKGILQSNFIFYTNYESRKANELSSNNKGAVLFFWEALDRQIRIEGTIKKAPLALSKQYFLSRPKAAQAAAIVSPQSAIISSKYQLIKNFQATLKNSQLNFPDNWGGYLLIPNYFEFWQGQKARLHDRICYKKTKQKKWKIYRLAP